MKPVLFSLMMLLLASSICSAVPESEILFVNTSLDKRTVSGKIFTRGGKSVPFTIVLQPKSSAYISTDDGINRPDKGFIYTIFKKHDQSDTSTSPLTRQLVVTLGENGKWAEVSGPGLDEQTSRQKDQQILTRNEYHSFSRIECEVDPEAPHIKTPVK